MNASIPPQRQADDPRVLLSHARCPVCPVLTPRLCTPWRWIPKSERSLNRRLRVLDINPELLAESL